MKKQRNMTGKWADKWKAKIDAFYSSNPTVQKKIKTYLQEAQLYKADPKETFRETVMGMMKKEGISVDRAIKKTLRTEAFMEKQAILHENAIKGIRGFKDAYEDWRKFTGHQKIDPDKLTYIGNNTYEYKIERKKVSWSVFIEYKNSPTDVRVWRVRA